jgi:hypothetical protein
MNNLNLTEEEFDEDAFDDVYDADPTVIRYLKLVESLPANFWDEVKPLDPEKPYGRVEGYALNWSYNKAKHNTPEAWRLINDKNITSVMPWSMGLDDPLQVYDWDVRPGLAFTIHEKFEDEFDTEDFVMPFVHPLILPKNYTFWLDMREAIKFGRLGDQA